MPYDLYWSGDPEAVRWYREADKERQRRKNQELWLGGLYVYEAIGDMVPVLRPLAKPGTAPSPYPSEPFATTAAENRERREKEEARKADNVQNWLMTWANEVNKQKEKEVGDYAERTDGTD